MNEFDFLGDPLLDSLLERVNSKEAIRIVDPQKHEALSFFHDVLVEMQRSAGDEENVNVKYHHNAGCAVLTAEVSSVYISSPWVLAGVLLEATKVHMAVTSGGKIRITVYFGGYFSEIC